MKEKYYRIGHVLKQVEHFERNFVSKRFTSYHEFFTTDKLAHHHVW